MGAAIAILDTAKRTNKAGRIYPSYRIGGLEIIELILMAIYCSVIIIIKRLFHHELLTHFNPFTEFKQLAK